MHEVDADGVAPMDVRAVRPAVGIVLVKEVILAVEIAEAIRIIQPPAAGGEVKLSAKRFVVEVFGILDVIALLDRIERCEVVGHSIHPERDGSAF